MFEKYISDAVREREEIFDRLLLLLLKKKKIVYVSFDKMY